MMNVQKRTKNTSTWVVGEGPHDPPPLCEHARAPGLC